MKIKRILSMTFALVMLLGMAAGMSQTAYAEGNTTEITPTKTSGTMTITLVIKKEISQTVTFKVVNGSWNDGTTTDKTVTLNGYEGDTLTLAAGDIPAVGAKPNADFEAGNWDVTPSTETAITEAITYTYTYAAKDYAAAQGVIDAINALPDPTNVTTANKDAIEAARAAYDALPEDQKAKVEADTLKKLADAEAALKAIADAGKLYYTMSGDGQDHVIESGEDATFTVKRSVADDATFSRFTGIQVDGVAVVSTNYEATKGSVIIKLKAAYLDTLSVGSHILKVLFTDGSVEIPFTVSKAAAADPGPAATAVYTVPPTGDAADLALWAGAMLLGAVGLAMLKKRKHN